jgi:hypothetical protein
MLPVSTSPSPSVSVSGVVPSAARRETDQVEDLVKS